MANWSVTNTFTNSTTADATQVNTNFTDIINASSDGTKDMSISALTCAGTATLNGSVNLGNASGDDLTITASLASSITIKTTNSYDIGASALALRSIYLASADSAGRATRIIGGSVASNWTLTTPTAAGSQYDVLENDGSGVTNFRAQRLNSSDLRNYSIAAAVAASALTLTLNAADGSAPDSNDPNEFVFRNATAATGTPVTRRLTSAPTLVISSGSTLGTTSGNEHIPYVYALDNAGTVELAISLTLFDEGTLQSTTAEGGAGGADSNAVLYSTTARTNVAIRLIARLKSTQTTAGTWAAVPTEISLPPFEKGKIVARYSTNTAQSIDSGAAAEIIDFDDKTTDTHGAVTTGASWKFTAPRVGNILINARMLFDSSAEWTAGETTTLYLYKNNAVYSVLDFYEIPASENVYISLQGSDIVPVITNDYIDIRIVQSSGGALTLYTDGAYNYVSIIME